MAAGVGGGEASANATSCSSGAHIASNYYILFLSLSLSLSLIPLSMRVKAICYSWYLPTYIYLGSNTVHCFCVVSDEHWVMHHRGLLSGTHCRLTFGL